MENRPVIANIGIMPFEQSAIQRLNPEHQELMNARFGKRLQDYEKSKSVEYCDTIISELMIHTQSNHLGNTLMKQTLVGSLIGEFEQFKRKFTFDDVRIALREGYRGTFGNDIIGLSAVSFAKCLRRYDNWEKRHEASIEYNKIIDAPKTTDKPVSDMFKLTDERVNECFSSWKETGKMDMIAWLYYDHIRDKIGQELAPVEVRRKFWAQAKVEYEKEHRSNGVKPDMIKQIMEHPDKNIVLINRGKMKTLIHYFEKNKHLEKII